MGTAVTTTLTHLKGQCPCDGKDSSGLMSHTLDSDSIPVPLAENNPLHRWTRIVLTAKRNWMASRCSGCPLLLRTTEHPPHTPLKSYILRSLIISHVCCNFSSEQRTEKCPLGRWVLCSHSKRPAPRKHTHLVTHSFHFPSRERIHAKPLPHSLVSFTR